MKKCSACGNVSKDEIMQCPYCGNTNFVPENYQAMPQMGQPVPQPNQNMTQQPMGQQPMPGYGAPMSQQPVQGYGAPMGQQPMPGYGAPMGQQPMPGPMTPQASQEKGNIAWGILGFFIPIVGWILYFVWKNTKPGDAKVAGIGGIIGFCFNLLITIIL